MDIELRKVVRENFDNVIALELEEAQENYIESNAYSIAESTLSPYFHLTHHRAVCMGDKVVGFV